ncbi:MAG: hypothetical protein AB8B48_18925, partial [Pseudomonadales bacterium]
GWLAAPFAEQYGGLQASSADIMVITEALGKGLMSEPFLAPSCVVVGSFVMRVAKSSRHAMCPQLLMDQSSGHLHSQNCRVATIWQLLV